MPEIGSGVVEIKAAAREPGHRTKIAVWSNDPNVDPVGACVGARGSRVRMVTNELRGERVDVVPFSDDPVELIQNALAPARVREVRLDEETGHRHGHRERLPALPRHRQGGAERPPGGAPHRLAHRHQERDPAGRGGGGGYGDQEWAEGEWVEDESGDLVWKPAEGGEAMSAEEWTHQAEDVGEAPAAEPAAADGAGRGGGRGGAPAGDAAVGRGEARRPAVAAAEVTEEAEA